MQFCSAIFIYVANSNSLLVEVHHYYLDIVVPQRNSFFDRRYNNEIKLRISGVWQKMSMNKLGSWSVVSLVD